MTARNLNALGMAMYRDFERLSGIERSAPSKAPAFSGDTPKCFSVKQYIFWKEKAREVNPGPLGPCVDCTAQRQRQMIREERCERPGVAFRLDQDGLVEGYYPRHVGALAK